MRLLLYYMLHSLKNQILKLCKSWVVVFILVCALIGGGLGLFAAEMEEAVTDGDEYYEEIPENEIYEDEEIIIEEELSPELINNIGELVCGGILLLYLVFSIYSADKSGSSIFLMADVNLLFSAPMKPQSVLMFRLLCQIGVMFLSSVYIGFQIPNLYYNLGFSLVSCIAIIIVLVLMIIYGRLISVLIYSVSSTYAKLKKFLTPAYLSVLAVIAAAFVAVKQSSGLGWYESAVSFFNSDISLYIPIWGWLKAIFVYALEQNIVMMAVMSLVSVVGIILLVWFIWSIKVDFYEDAMAKSSEMAEKMAQAKSEGKQLAKRSKDRSDRLKRNGELGGSGASVIFTKEMYNRARFGKFFIVTKTCAVYLCVSVFASSVLGMPFEGIAIGLAVMAFFRALGDTVTKEVSMDSFLLIPEPPFKKVFYAHLAAVVNCVIDTLPAIVVTAIVSKASIVDALVYLLVVAAVDFYSSGFVTAIDLSLPTSVSFTIKQVITVMFVYFGIVPIVIVGCITGVAFESLSIGIVSGGISAVVLAIVSVLVSSRLLYTGKK